MTAVAEPVASRRRLLGMAIGFSGAMVLGLAGCQRRSAAPVCGAPDQLNDEQMSLRTSLRYTESAPGPETCSACAFFKAQENGACGNCELLKGPVNPQGHCVSWSRKEAAAS